MDEKSKKIELDKERIKRYKEKMEILQKYLIKLEEWTSNIDYDVPPEKLDMRDKFALYHLYQLIIEIITDLCAMTVKDLKILPKDDYSNINILAEKKIIPENLADDLRKANGLRNRMVHDYNGVIEKIVNEGILQHKEHLIKFLEVFTLWLKKVL